MLRRPPFGLFFLWLVVVFLSGVALRFWGAQTNPNKPDSQGMLLPERLAVISKFAPDLSSEVREQLLGAALMAEDDPDRKAVYEGRLEEPKSDLRGNTRLMAEYLKAPDAEKKRELEAAAAKASERTALCFALFGIVLICAVGWSLLGFFRREAPPVEPEPLGPASPGRLLAVFLGWDVLNLFVVSSVMALVTQALPSLVSLILGQFAAYGLLLLMLKRGGLERWNLKSSFSLTWVGRGYFLCYLLVFLVNAVLAATMGKQPISSNPLIGLFLESSAWQVGVLAMLVVLVGPFFEELLFRGWLYGGLRQYWGDTKALVVSSALFAIIHADLWATPALFVLGMVFGTVYRRTGSLWSCILLHAMWNGTTFIFLLSNMP